MSEDNIKRLFKHFENLAEKGGKTGNQIRDELIKSDAISNLAELKAKFPNLYISKAKEDKEEKPIKSKEKK